MSNIKIQCSPIRNEIFAGSVLKDGRTWGKNKTEVTIEALCAVAEHVTRFGEPVEIREADGTPVYKITVEKLDPVS